ncbi:MAG: hypothetical protein A2498_00260 [Lentisphaerae bacterium RIFOXYC12_FULL_60_16]|nr:MAG: hypothetical protein A2498_00260 [Lentisphaerae bacterium RIFOXYC12_FULL_60_16]
MSTPQLKKLFFSRFENDRLLRLLPEELQNRRIPNRRMSKESESPRIPPVDIRCSSFVNLRFFRNIAKPADSGVFGSASTFGVWTLPLSLCVRCSLFAVRCSSSLSLIPIL